MLCLGEAAELGNRDHQVVKPHTHILPFINDVSPRPVVPAVAGENILGQAVAGQRLRRKPKVPQRNVVFASHAHDGRVDRAVAFEVVGLPGNDG